MTDDYKFYIMGSDRWASYYRISGSNTVEFFSTLSLDWLLYSRHEPRPLDVWIRKGLKVTPISEDDFNHYALSLRVKRELSK